VLGKGRRWGMAVISRFYRGSLTHMPQATWIWPSDESVMPNSIRSSSSKYSTWVTTSERWSWPRTFYESSRDGHGATRSWHANAAVWHRSAPWDRMKQSSCQKLLPTQQSWQKGRRVGTKPFVCGICGLACSATEGIWANFPALQRQQLRHTAWL